MKRKYTWVLANRDSHSPIKTWQQFSKAHRWDTSLGLFCNGVAVGCARLRMKNARCKFVHTDGTELFRGFRGKGHGIELYTALIETARALGAKRIYSSTNLNRFSTRMWAEKLDRRYTVVHLPTTCRRACRHCRFRDNRHYIQL